MKRHLAPNLHVPLALNMRHSWGLVAALACCWTCGGLEPGVFWLLTQFGLCLPWRRGRLTRDSSILAGIWPHGRLGGFYKCNQNPLWRPIRSYWRIRISEWCTPGSIPPGPVKAPPVWIRCAITRQLLAPPFSNRNASIWVLIIVPEDNVIVPKAQHQATSVRA